MGRREPGGEGRGTVGAGLLLALAACAAEPRRIEDCGKLRGTAAVENCRWRFVEPVADDPEALRAALAAIPEAASRDLVRLRLAIEHPDRAASACREVETPGARERCEQVLGRPHLGAAERHRPGAGERGAEAPGEAPAGGAGR